MSDQEQVWSVTYDTNLHRHSYEYIVPSSIVCKYAELTQNNSQSADSLAVQLQWNRTHRFVLNTSWRSNKLEGTITCLYGGPD